MEQESLVSVYVLTYNSSKYVIDTLESIKAQTYRNIQLIISDDCSTDNTIDICNLWIEKNKNRFYSTHILTSEKNRGVSFNKNQAFCAVKGKWVKGIAGDDKLKSTCIQQFVEFAERNNYSICICRLEPFSDENIDVSSAIKDSEFYFSTTQTDRKGQLNQILKRYTFQGPGMFYSKELYDEVGGCDERIPMWEEFSFVYRVLKKGYRIEPLDEKLIEYRISNSSLCHAGKTKTKGQLLFDKSRRLTFYYYILPEYIKRFKLLKVWSMCLSFERDRVNDVCVNSIIKIMCIFLLNIIDPMFYYLKVKRFFKKLDEIS